MGSHKNAPKVIEQGITGENCRWRNKGCRACIDELEAEGFFKEDDFYKDPDVIYTSINERGIQQSPTITEADRMQFRARNAFLEGINAKNEITNNERG